MYIAPIQIQFINCYHCNSQFNCAGVSQFYPQCSYGIAEINCKHTGRRTSGRRCDTATNLQGVRATPTTAGRATTIAEAVFGVVAARQPIDVAGR